MHALLRCLGRIALTLPFAALSWYLVATDHPVLATITMCLAFGALVGSDPDAEPGSFWAGLGDADGGGDGGGDGGCGGGCGGG